MGNLFTSIWDKPIVNDDEINLILVGLDGAGKTTILYKLHWGEITN